MGQPQVMVSEVPLSQTSCPYCKGNMRPVASSDLTVEQRANAVLLSNWQGQGAPVFSHQQCTQCGSVTCRKESDPTFND